jgi:hypothetical protein
MRAYEYSIRQLAEELGIGRILQQIYLKVRELA